MSEMSTEQEISESLLALSKLPDPSSLIVFFPDSEKRSIDSLICSLLFEENNDKTTNKTAVEVNTLPPDYLPWITEWRRIGSISLAAENISPFELHALVSQLRRNESYSNPNPSSILLSTTYLLLCCHALYQCPRDPPRMRKRWKSLVWETLQLYQRQWSCLNFGGEETNLDETWELRVSILCRRLVPSVWHVRKELLKSERNDLHFAAGSLAAAVSLLSHLLTEITSSSSSHQEPLKLCPELLATMDEVVEGRWELVWCHPQREAQRLRMQNNQTEQPTLQSMDASSSFDDCISFWTCWRQELLDTEEGEECSELVCFVDTIWEPAAISLATSYSFFSEYRPRTWQPSYTWDLFFSHVPILLEQDKQTQDSCLSFHIAGFRLLQGLLGETPAGILTIAPSYFRQEQPLEQSRPDHPALQTFQLLSNHIIRVNTLTRSLETGLDVEDDCEETLSPTLQLKLLPSATECYQQYMKGLISKYRPANQVDLVRYLVQACPHPGFKPKLLDLLRISLTQPEWRNDAEALGAALGFLDALWDQVVKACFADPSFRVMDGSEWGKLVDNAELLVSLLSVFRLWRMLRDQDAIGGQNHCQSLRVSLQPFHQLLTANLEQWAKDTNDNDAPQEYHRLFLLENILEETIALL